MRIGGIGSVAIEEPEKTAPLAPRPIEEPDHAPRPANDTDAPRAPIDTAPHPAGSLDACRLRVTPVDAAPKRSPQAVHSVLRELFRGSSVVEIGTRNGDGMACFASAAASAVAVEMNEAYCAKLRTRSTRARGGGPLFGVQCSDYRTARLDADFVTWWQQLPHLCNEGVLSHLVALQRARRLKPSAVAVVLFDHSWADDTESYARLAPYAHAL